jgi:hypothetical protein
MRTGSNVYTAIPRDSIQKSDFRLRVYSIDRPQQTFSNEGAGARVFCLTILEF